MPEVTADDPTRCKQSVGQQQCPNGAEPGSDFCRAHRGNDLTNMKATRLYLLAKADDQARLLQFSDHEEIRSLREEIAIARMLVEKRWNLIKTDSDLIMSCGSVNTLLLTIERLVKSAHTIEQNLGVLLGKSAVLSLGQLICHIIIEELEGIENYEAIVDSITRRILTTIAGAKDNSPETMRVIEAKRLTD
jgi:hypothetical protein